jgi:uncharacterized protein (DUF4415 family)
MDVLQDVASRLQRMREETATRVRPSRRHCAATQARIRETRDLLEKVQAEGEKHQRLLQQLLQRQQKLERH